MSTKNRSSNIYIVALVVSASTIAAAAFALHRRRRFRLRAARSSSPRDLFHNSSAKGSDVVSVYEKHISTNGIYVISGSTSGLGREMALLLGRAGANLILAVRNTEEGDRVKQEIQSVRSTGSTIQVWELDLSTLKSVRSFCRKFRETYGDAQVVAGLVNNAGVFKVEGRTIDGYQTTWQTNAMAPAFLAELMLPFMTKTARIVNVSSEMYKIVGSVSKHCPPVTSGASTFDYALSKACQVLHAHELTLRFEKQGVERRAMAVDPGLVRTNIARHASRFHQWLTYRLLGPFLERSCDEGCATILFCLLAPKQDLMMNESDETRFYFYANCAPMKATRCCSSLVQVRKQTDLFDSLWKRNDKV